MKFVKPEELKSYIGREVGVSDWCAIDQERINKFADVTDDHQFIHVDPDAAKASPFGTTIAHGFLTLSMLSRLAEPNVLVIDGIKAGVNYGFDKVRFIAPVKSGKRIRGRFKLMKADERLPGQWSIKYAATVEIEGEDKPALMAEWLTMQIT